MFDVVRPLSPAAAQCAADDLDQAQFAIDGSQQHDPSIAGHAAAVKVVFHNGIGSPVLLLVSDTNTYKITKLTDFDKQMNLQVHF